MSSTDPLPTLLLVDGHAYAYRAFYAIRSLNSPDGSPTNAIYGFVKMLQKMENILRAGKTGTVKSIAAAQGESLSVDQVILELD